jgi:hypothetical protein
MKYLLLISALLGTLSLSACDQPTIVTVPASPVAVPGTAGATGSNGSQRTGSYAGAIEKIWDRHHGHRDARSFSASNLN